MTPIKACIFDLDGVIVDTAGFHYHAWKRLAAQIGCDFTEHDNERLKGVSRMRSLEIILDIGGIKLDEKTREKLAAQKNEWYMEDVLKMSPADLLPGVMEFITALKKNGYKIALGSASKNSRVILEKINIVSYFDVLIDGNKVTHAKPDPEVFLKGAEELGVPPSSCVVFEDAIAGIEAAKNAGMYCVAIGSPEHLSKADLVISSFNELSIERLKEFEK